MGRRTAISFCILFIPLFSAAYAAPTDGAERSLLLDFKAKLSDPNGLLSGWASSVDHCAWLGISCDAGGRVVAINISAAADDPSTVPCFRLGPFKRRCFDPGRRLTGTLSPAIGELAGLKYLSLPFHSFRREIPGAIWRLRKLEVLDLEGSSLTGFLPSSFPRALRVLNLASNSIEGEIPLPLSRCAHLETLDLSRNQLKGSIPGFLGDSPNLRRLDLSFNQLEKSIPDDIGSGRPNLEYLDISGNMLIGKIPRSLGNCRQLRSLLLFSNFLDGGIPSDLGKLRNLQVLDVSRNSLSGPIPDELGNCQQLTALVLSSLLDPMLSMSSSIHAVRDEYNYFQGRISEKITTLPKLTILWAPRGNLQGQFPGNWGPCESLSIVNLAQNLFTGKIPATFGRCKNLNFLDLSMNNLIGQINEDISVPCMAFLDISGNNLSGSIPEFAYKNCSLSSSPADDLLSAYTSFFISRSFAEIALPSFDTDINASIHHNFGRNNFDGNMPSLPVASTKISHNLVYVFRIDQNFISGTLTESIFGKCEQFGSLIVNFSNNLISGELPADIGFNCKALKIVNAAGNHIQGIIPESIGLLDRLVELDLSMNQLNGQITADLSGLKRLKYLKLAHNNLSGKIPASVSALLSLVVLDLSSNNLAGEIPFGLVNLRNLSVLLLDNNKISGKIPFDFANATLLSKLNLSFNNLSGPLPFDSSRMKCDSFCGNPLLQACQVLTLSVPPSYLQRHVGDASWYVSHSSQSQPPPPTTSNGGFNSIEIASIASAAAICSILLAMIVFYVYTRKCMASSSVQSSERKEVTIFVDIGVPLTYETVVRAAGNFNASNCIGSGGFGATYKAEISPGILVAIKRLAVGRCQGLQQFHAEIKTLGRWRHPNLVTLIGYHISNGEMFLIYNYLPGGNLERFLHQRSGRAAEWTMLHKIALDVAQALAYLHDHCMPRILHRDVKPSNILLDNEFNAYLSDFGLARLLGSSETHATTGVAGTYGYVAPEYAMTSRVSDKADVYSYGVVLMELLSDKKVLDPSFSPYGNGFNIVAWASMLILQNRADEFFVDGLWHADCRRQLIEMLKLAIRCTEEQLTQRPSMKHVVRQLKELQPPAG